MDYLYIGMKALNFLVIPLGFYIAFKMKKSMKKIVSLSKENNELKTRLQRAVEESLQEIEERMDELNHEVKDLHAHLIKLHQDQISWITSSKELPDPSKMVLVLDKDKKEGHGFLNQGNESWTLTSLGGTMGKVSLEKITHWKPIFHL